MDPMTAAPALTPPRAAARPAWAGRYLARLGLDDPGEPSLPALRALHRGHVERVPYEALDIQLRRPTSVAPQESVRRILRGRGGYCVQLNTAFGALLTALGYRVSGHRAGIQGRGAPGPSDAGFAPHLALTVELEGARWLVDVGLGDGLHEPLPLREGTHRHGPLEMRLRPSRVEPDGWRLDHDPLGSIAGMDVRAASAGNAEFARWHPYLASSPRSRLVRAVTVMQRDAAGADVLMGCVLRRVDAAGVSARELATAGEWFGALADVFGLRLQEVPEDDRAALWARVRAAHEAWRAAKERRGPGGA